MKAEMPAEMAQPQLALSFAELAGAWAGLEISEEEISAAQLPLTPDPWYNMFSLSRTKPKTYGSNEIVYLPL